MQQQFVRGRVKPGWTRVGGFSLIELMIVVTILSILLGLAVPRYTDHLDKARRNDGRGALLELSAQQERHHFENNQYSGEMGALWSNKNGDDYVSAEGFYTLTVTTADSGQQYTVTATAPKADSNAVSIS